MSILNGVNRLLISLDRTEYTVNNRVMQQKCESVLTGILGTPIQSDKTYDLQIQVGSGVYDIYTLDGCFGDPVGGSTTTRPPVKPPEGVDDVDDVDGVDDQDIDVTVVKKDICDDGECKDLKF